MHRWFLIPLLLLLPWLASCKEAASVSQPAASGESPAATDVEGQAAEAGEIPLPQQPQAPAAPAQAPLKKREAEFDFTPGGPISDQALANYFVELEVSVDGKSAGIMVLDFWPEVAPITVRNFLRYAAEGFYDGKVFHRIMRDFMVQGGDPTGTGGGDGPYGEIKGEFHKDPKYRHEYGVLSMAREGGNPDSASCQFFICCDSTPQVWNLDGQYAAFGRLVGGVSALEAMADVKVGRSINGQMSRPMVEVKILRAEVKKGDPPPSEEKIERPPVVLDLKGQPEKVEVQHVLISFQGAGPQGVTRNKTEAEALAKTVLERAQKGEDFTALVREFSDDPVKPGDPQPGTYRMLNRGVRDRAFERLEFRLEKEWRAFQEDLRRRVNAKELSAEEAGKEVEQKRSELMAQLLPNMVLPRDQMVQAFGDVSFNLKVGEVGMAAYDLRLSRFGWHIIKRLK
ncbi:MAG: hypothetical protein DWQ01_20440 [Planctomycetota bacterium]|nr:MAG: hypothetical protein DWQ01_20440 [Planctomycetota bacterium]